MKKLSYAEGSVFAVPLRDEGYARGVVARSDPKGEILFGYFFGPRILQISEASVNELQPSDAIVRLRFGALGLRNGEWPVLGLIPDWNRLSWPISDFVRRDPMGRRRTRLVRYLDDPSQAVAEYAVEDDPRLPADSLSGYGAVEIKLTVLLANSRGKVD